MTISTMRASSMLLALLVSACNAAPDPTDAERVEAALDEISSETLEAHVAWLADDKRLGREPGEPGYEAAAAYVAEQFAALGLEPAGNDGWYQPVALRSYRVAGEGAQATLHRDGRDTTLSYLENFFVLADPVEPASDVRADIVFVGHGVHAPELDYSDYDAVDVSGKIVAMFSGAPASFNNEVRAHYANRSQKIELAASRGAVGTILLRKAQDEERFPWQRMTSRIGKRFAMTWLSPDNSAANYYPQIKVRAALDLETSESLFGLSPLSYQQAVEASADGRPASADLGVEARLSMRTEHKTISSPNVVGLVRGTDPELADEYIVYTAHLDHIGVLPEHGEKDLLFNGAYDNAMGVALMLETARALSAAPPKRSVLFVALTAEEKGLLGSDYFARYPTVPIESMVANINLDMPLFIYPPADLVAFGSERSSMHGFVEGAAREEGFVLSPDPMPEQNLFVRSDQYSFVKQGVPAVYLIPGFQSANADEDGEALYRDHLKNHYHEPTDDMTRPIDWDSARRFARANARIGLAIGDSQERPAWNEGDFFGERFAR